MQMMKEMKAEIADLKSENSQLKGNIDEVAVATDEAIKAQVSLFNKTSIGGYGELHLNKLSDQKGTSDTDQIDFHRFVLFFGHEFTDDIRFFSELELEHSLSGEGKPGEVELEQAYIQVDITDKTSTTLGLFLMPVGILNETHEPQTFYGVERNSVEKNIIPTTWWEGGAMVTSQISDGITLDLAYTSGLKATSSLKPRDGRQKVAEASAKDGATWARLKWTGLPGVELGATVNYQADYAQDSLTNVDEALLTEVHAVINKGPWGLRALYARWDIDGSRAKDAGTDDQYGYYIEPSYKFNVAGDDVGIFVRHSMWDNSHGAGSSSDTKYKQFDVGVNWWLHSNVVVKLDYQSQDVGSGISKELDGVNLGIGYEF
jgi:phosphate-selective porin